MTQNLLIEAALRRFHASPKAAANKANKAKKPAKTKKKDKPRTYRKKGLINIGRLLTTKQAARKLRCSAPTVLHRVHDKCLTAIKVGRSFMVGSISLEEFKKKQLRRFGRR